MKMAVRERVGRYLEYCKHRKGLDIKTIKAYRIDLRQYFEHFQDGDPQKEEIEEYIEELHVKFKQRTVKRKIASVRAFYNHLEEEGIIEVNPFRLIRVKFKETVTLPRIIPRNEIEKLLGKMYSGQKTGEGLRDIAVVEVFFATGARVYEVSNIKMDNVDLDSGLVRIMGKGGKERYIQIADEAVLGVLKRYHAENEEAIRKSGYFFVNRRGKRLTEQSIRDMMKKHTKRAGIDRNITPHMWRHSFATYLIEEGVDISFVQQILGHSSIKTTQIYIHIAAEKQAEVLRAMHPRKRMRVGVVA